MVSYKGYVAGWLDSSIGDFLADLPKAFPTIEYALITCLDSHPKPATVKTNSVFEPIRRDLHQVGQGVLLPTRLLLLNDFYRQVFFGFDEVWFFPHEITEPKPDGAWLVGPAKVDQHKLEKLGDWMSSNSCSLALGDGSGLNLVLKGHGLVRYLLAHTLEMEKPDTKIGLAASDAV